MNKNNGVTLIKLLIILLIITILISLIGLNFFTDISQSIDIFYKTISKQINLKEEIIENEILLGITDVKGEGIIINILDGKDLIHQEDLIILIDELKNSGSQAISINGQRITNSSYLYCDGSVILIDGEKIGNPFIVKAIGDKEVLYGALMRTKGYISVLENDGLKIDIEKSDNIEISKTKKESLINYSENKTKVGKLKDLNQLVGKSDIKGKGIEIIIYENKAKLTALSFLQFVNDLWSGGARAISINGQRITNMTDIMDISNTYVLVNSIPISTPYIIHAVGDVDKMEEALNYNNSHYNKIKDKGNEIELYKVYNLTIGRYIQKKDKNKMAIDYLK